MESARSMPRYRVASSGSAAATAPYAPSTWNQQPCSAATSAMAASGSTTPVFTVPALATTHTGSSPAARSAAIAVRSAPTSMRYSRSTGTSRRASLPRPSSSTARRMQEWASLDAYIVGCLAAARRPRRRVPGNLASRQPASATRFAMDPPLTSSPPAPRGRPTSCASQCITVSPTCTAIWLVPAQLFLSVAAISSAAMPMGCGGELMNPHQRRWPTPSGYGTISRSMRSRMPSSETPWRGRGSARQRATSSSGGRVYAGISGRRSQCRTATSAARSSSARNCCGSRSGAARPAPVGVIARSRASPEPAGTGDPGNRS